MAKTSLKFGAAVQAVLNDHGWSFRGATIATGIDYNTIGNMKSGIVPSRGKVIEWAEKINEPINKWLVLAGYEPIPAELCLPEDMPSEIREEIMRLLKRVNGA